MQRTAGHTGSTAAKNRGHRVTAYPVQRPGTGFTALHSQPSPQAVTTVMRNCDLSRLPAVLAGSVAPPPLAPGLPPAGAELRSGLPLRSHPALASGIFQFAQEYRRAVYHTGRLPEPTGEQ